MINEIIENFSSSLSKADVRERIASIEAGIKKLPQQEIKETHYFSKGCYAREIFIPRGTLLVGKIHKFENLNIISQGRATVVSIDGARCVEAPCTFVASPGVKRVIYAHEDTVWTNVHGTDERDLAKIESAFIATSYNDLELSAEEIAQLREAGCLG